MEEIKQRRKRLVVKTSKNGAESSQNDWTAEVPATVQWMSKIHCLLQIGYHQSMP